VSEQKEDRPPGGLEPDQGEGVRPHRLAMLILVLFPFALMAVVALLYVWIRG
jgi:hypothetical protein